MTQGHDLSQTGDGGQDYKALLEAEQQKTANLTAAADKLGRDNSSLRGDIRKYVGKESEAQDSASAIQGQLSALARAIESGESEGLASSVGKFSEDVALNATHERFLARAEAVFSELEEALLGEDGEPILELKTAPELEDTRGLWSKGVDSDTLTYGDRLDLFQQAVGKAHKAARTAVRLKKKAVADADQETRVQGLDNDSGGGGASASNLSLDGLIKKDLRTMTHAEKIKFLADLDTAYKFRTK